MIALTGCATNSQNIQNKPTGSTFWSNPDHLEQVEKGVMTQQQYEHKWILAESECEIEALKVPIASPSCTVTPAPNCQGLTGFALGFCRSQTSQRHCDYSAVNASKNAQERIFSSCLRLKGWKSEWIED